jgi:Lon protease-like protein
VAELLPIFPLPNVVLFPNVFLPLHIFEPRYREMVADAVRSDRLIGMALLRPGWEHDYDGRPAVYPVGCSGVITHVDHLSDGRYNIVLRGVERFRILDEDFQLSYRRAVVESLPDMQAGPNEKTIIRHQRAKLESLLAPTVERSFPASSSLVDRSGHDSKIPTAMADEDLVNALAQYLDLEPLERQALLERHSLCSRAESLVELLEMKILIARTPGVSNVAH